MLDELGPWLTPSKALDLVNRLETQSPEQCLPAEYELALSWAISRNHETEIEPKFGNKTPDLRVDNLFPGKPAVVEIIALTDDALSDKSVMNRTANIICQFADTVSKQSSKHLHFHFHEKSGYKPGKQLADGRMRPSQFVRYRLTSPDFALSSDHKAKIKEWLGKQPTEEDLHIQDDGTSVVVRWQAWTHPSSREFSTMPSLAHHLTDNPLYKRLKEKEKRQLSKVPAQFTKCLFVCDAGCDLLRRFESNFSSGSAIPGKTIIENFVYLSKIVDMVVVFSPHAKNDWPFNQKRTWHIQIVDKWQRPEGFHDRLSALQTIIPAPQFDGYQAYSVAKQGMFSPQSRGHYLPTTYIGKRRNQMTIKVSARAMLELLAGRIDKSKLTHFVTGEPNQFEQILSQGNSISGISFESCADSQDDDYVILEFAPDPNASSLRLPHQMMADKKGDGGNG